MDNGYPSLNKEQSCLWLVEYIDELNCSFRNAIKECTGQDFHVR